MRSLDTSLPRSPRKKRSNPPPEQLIQTFKAAALSVTNLYKTAAADQTRACEAGYQDALDDILAFLDKENLGLGDGEGWRVRQWATERLDGSPILHSGGDSDEDRGETMGRARSSSPVIQRTAIQETEPSRSNLRSTSPLRAGSAPVGPPPSAEQQDNLVTVPSQEVFSFRSGQSYPPDMDLQAPDASNNVSLQTDPHLSSQIPSSGAAVRVEVVPRGSRISHRSSRHGNRAAGGPRSLGSGAGSKRAFRFGDYEFDLGDLEKGRDTSGGGGKRGRFT